MLCWESNRAAALKYEEFELTSYIVGLITGGEALMPLTDMRL